MALPQDINDREYRKFDDNGRVLVNTDLLPTSGNNGSLTFSYDGSGNLQYIDETIGSTTYRTTLTYDGSNNLTGVSSAVET